MDKTMRILVADDFSTMRKIIGNLLDESGYSNIEEAGDGVTALAKLQNEPVDFLITDWDMPNLSGIELLRAVRADANTQDLPVLMVTADAKRERIFEAVEAGVNGYIVKPFTAGVLAQKIERIFARIYGGDAANA